MKFNILFFLVFGSSYFFAQSCKCLDEFDFVVNYYEQNLPGFNDNVSVENQSEYDLFKKGLREKALGFCENKVECFRYLLKYVEFFKDNHSSIYFNDVIPKSYWDTIATFEILGGFEGIKNPIPELQNRYISNDSVYTVVIVEKNSEHYDFLGIIIDSKTPNWKGGDVKFELKKKANGKYDLLQYMRNRSTHLYQDVEFKDGVLANNWFNIQLKSKKSYATDAPNELVFKSLDKETNYISIPTFSGNWTAKLDSFYKKHDSAIRSKSKLIIDVRNNGGGSDDNANPLLKYIYTKPFYTDKVELFVTEENIRKSVEWYENNKLDTINFDTIFMQEILDEIDTMKKTPLNTFITRVDKQKIELDSVLTKPSKVAILMNRNCASSCEALLFWAKESDKTILLGENSGGYVGYGEIETSTTPNFNYLLGCTMTRYEKQRQFEAEGIPPTHYLLNDKDWIKQAVKWLK
jgi:hypothetical protein